MMKIFQKCCFAPPLRTNWIGFVSFVTIIIFNQYGEVVNYIMFNLKIGCLRIRFVVGFVSFLRLSNDNYLDSKRLTGNCE